MTSMSLYQGLVDMIPVCDFGDSGCNALVSLPASHGGCEHGAETVLLTLSQVYV